MVEKIRARAVKVIKASLVATRDFLGKSRYLRRVGTSVRKTLVPPPSQAPDQYSHKKYYPAVPEYHRQREIQASFAYRPLISVLMPTYNTNHQFLRECLDSILMQSYDKWELCIADDASPDGQVVEIVREYAQRDTRIRYTRRSENGHISIASNTALEMADGEYVALMDHDDLLWPNALFEIVSALNM